jgi:hypothetical protein
MLFRVRAPGQFRISPDQQSRQSGHGRSHRPAAGDIEHDLVPDVGQTIDFQVRLIGQYRHSGKGLVGPRAAGLDQPAGFGRERVDLQVHGPVPVHAPEKGVDGQHPISPA